ncbi:HNH endonuclease signature motif containing protein [Labedella endophytica]|uniref:HNH endonuclease n=1 Tax=Labedella endophytica TaxID=1523160 RepID=A0A433JSY0_9MICO|nr:HNH endonuclease signature motif containing protein [Labedella endophytica]RUR01508.1 HNH endonuclease [Labedella endophytica]
MGEHGTHTDEQIEGAIGLLEALAAESFAPELVGSESADGAASPASLTGVHLLERFPRIERLGRLADALRVRYAAEAGTRADSPVDTLGAAGYASAKDAVAQLAGVSDPEAGRRIRVGEGTAPGVALSGAPTSPRYPAVATALAEGALGIEAADVIIRELGAVASRVDPVVLHEAESGLVDLAAGHDGQAPLRVDLVRIQVKAFLLAIDPDGARPRKQRARYQRRLSFGAETLDGLIPVSGLLVAEVGATFKRLVEAHVPRVAFIDDEDRVPASADDRTRAQRRHDVLADILGAASRVKDAPELAGAAPAVIVTVAERALTLGRGVGYLDGHDMPLSLDSVERLIDSRGLQAVTMNDAGRVLSLGSTQRCFTASQRRAIIARDGGCVIPGCTTPAGWCEVHHVTPWRAGGDTHVDNGVLLCWGHHQRIDSGPWRLSMPNGVPHVRGPGHHEWTPITKSRARPSSPRTG